MREELIERMARTIMLAMGCGLTREGKRIFCGDCDCPEAAQAALDAITDAGFAVVPVEPTEAMCIAGADELFASAQEDWLEEAAIIYRAMLAAAGGGE